MSKIITVLILGTGLWGMFMCLIVGIFQIQDLKTILTVAIVAGIIIVVLVDLWIFKGN